MAGIGNVFLGDDGFGVETARRLAERDLPGHIEVVDIGVRGVHLAYQLLDGYDTLVLVDATARGEAPGTLYVIEHDMGGGSPSPAAPALDGHRMTPTPSWHSWAPCAPEPAASHHAASWSWDANRPRWTRASVSARRCPTPYRKPSG